MTHNFFLRNWTPKWSQSKTYISTLCCFIKLTWLFVCLYKWQWFGVVQNRFMRKFTTISRKILWNKILIMFEFAFHLFGFVFTKPNWIMKFHLLNNWKHLQMSHSANSSYAKSFKRMQEKNGGKPDATHFGALPF